MTLREHSFLWQYAMLTNQRERGGKEKDLFLHGRFNSSLCENTMRAPSNSSYRQWKAFIFPSHAHQKKKTAPAYSPTQWYIISQGKKKKTAKKSTRRCEICKTAFGTKADSNLEKGTETSTCGLHATIYRVTIGVTRYVLTSKLNRAKTWKKCHFFVRRMPIKNASKWYNVRFTLCAEESRKFFEQ